MKSKQEQIKDVLERHYHGRNQLEERCSLDLLILFEGWEHWDEEHTLDMVMNDMACDLTERDIECILEANDNPKEPNEVVNTTTFQFTPDITSDIDEDNNDWDGFTDTSLKQDDYNDDDYDY